jgi:hypothetical protein
MPYVAASPVEEDSDEEEDSCAASPEALELSTPAGVDDSAFGSSDSPAFGAAEEEVDEEDDSGSPGGFPTAAGGTKGRVMADSLTTALESGGGILRLERRSLGGSTGVDA